MTPTASIIPEPNPDLIRMAAAQFPPAPALETMARDRLYSILVGLGILHWLAAAAWVTSLKLLPVVAETPSSDDGWPAVSPSLVALVGGTFLLLLRLLLPRLPLRWADPVGALVATLSVTTCLCWFISGNTPEKTVPLAFVLAGSGFFLFSSSWLVLVVTIAVVGWGSFALQSELGRVWWFYTGVLLSAVGLAFVLHRQQYLTLRRIMMGRPPEAPPAPPPAIPDEESEGKFRRWYEATFEGIAIHERGVIIEANPMLGKMLGCSAAELAGKNLLEWFTLASRALVEDSLLLGNYRPFEAVIRRADKTEVPLELFSKELPFKGRPAMVTAFRDITERQRASDALLAEQQQLQRQYRRQTAIAEIEFNIDQQQELTPVLQRIAAGAARHLPASTGACLMLCGEAGFALAASELNPSAVESGFSPVGQLAAIAEWIVTNQELFVASSAAQDDPFHVNDPVPVVGAYVGFPLIEHGKVLGVLFAIEEEPRQFRTDDLDFVSTLASRAAVVISKIRLYEELRHANKLLIEQSASILLKNTELARAKEAAEAADRIKGDFLATVSHELRTPLNGVVGMTSILQQTELNPEQRDYLETLQASAESLLGSINRIFDFINLDAGDPAALAGLCDVRAALTETLAHYREKFRDKPLQFEVLLPPQLPARLRGNAEALRQILTHLLDNAVKFTDHGRIAVEAASASETENQLTLRFTVTDTGIGIPPEAQDRLFQSFTQVDGSHKRKYGGLGLGLAISKQLVTRLGGTIGADSALGRGSSFWFTLPFEKG